VHRRGRRCGHSKALVLGVRCDPHHIGRHGTSTLCDASVAVAAQTAKPSAVRSQRLCLRPPEVTQSIGDDPTAAGAVRIGALKQLVVSKTQDSSRGFVELVRNNKDDPNSPDHRSITPQIDASSTPGVGPVSSEVEAQRPMTWLE